MQLCRAPVLRRVLQLGGNSVCLQCRRPGFDPWFRKIPWRRKQQPTPVLVPGKFNGRRSLVGYSPWGCKELDMTEELSTAQPTYEPARCKLSKMQKCILMINHMRLITLIHTCEIHHYMHASSLGVCAFVYFTA